MPNQIRQAGAGAGKTGTLVHLICADILTAGDSAAVAVLTNSVREEITERVRTCCFKDGLDIIVTRRGNANEIRHAGGAGLVTVSSADSLVHKGLLSLGFSGTSVLRRDDGREVDGGNFDEKRQILRDIFREEPGAADRAVAGIICGASPDVVVASTSRWLMMDEFQDLCDVMVEIATAMCIAVARAGGHFQVVGDPRQNVYAKSENGLHEFRQAVLNAIQEEEEEGEGRGEAGGGASFAVEDVKMNICYRCPTAHIDLVNAIFDSGEGDIMVAADLDHRGHRPILVATRADDVVASASAIAAEAEHQIRSQELALDEVAVLAPQVNDNATLAQLELELNRRLADLAPPDSPAVKWFLTGQTQGSIDWSQSKDRIAMLSVHADKGRTHALTIVCDATEGVLPPCSFGRSFLDVREKSLLYVALTRSRQSLIIGFGHGELDRVTLYGQPSTLGAISRYVRQKFETIDDLLELCDWSQHSLRRPHEVEWPRVSAYPPPSSSQPRQAMPTTINQWAELVSPHKLLPPAATGGDGGGDDVAIQPVRFAPDATGAPGMGHVRNVSLERAIGTLAQLRLQTAIRDLTGGATAPPPYRGWLAGAATARQRGLEDVAAALECAVELCRDPTPQGADGAPDMLGPRLWCLAQVANAEVTDSIETPSRPWSLRSAAAGFATTVGPDATAAVHGLAALVDANARRAAELLLQRYGAKALRESRFEVEYRRRLPGRSSTFISGRADLWIPPGRLLEIKATTMAATEAAKQDEDEGAPSVRPNYLSQVLLYAGMSNTPISEASVLDVTLGMLWSHTLEEGEHRAILPRAASIVAK